MTRFDANANEVGKHQDLDMLNEKREATQLLQTTYKTHTDNYYKRRVRVKKLKLGEWVLRKNECNHAQPQGNLSVT